MIRKVSAFLVAAFVFAACPAFAQFAEQASWAGTGSGAANVQTATLPNVLTYADILGVPVKYMPGFSNSGATTLNINGIGGQPVQRVTPAGMAALGGGEIIAGHAAIVMWNGTVFDLQNSAAPDPPGHVMDYAGSTCPTGWVAANGGTQTQANQLPLYGVLSTIWGSNSGGNFTLPDLRGRATFGQDSGGSGRITSAGGNFDGTVIGNTGGQQNQTLSIAQLPVTTPTVASTNLANVAINAQTQDNITITGTTHGWSQIGSDQPPVNASITMNSFGSGNSHPVLSNAAIVNKCVRF